MPDAKRQARVTTKTGDTGDTSLFGPGRIRKSDPRIEALGALDETQSAIGLARAMASGSIAETLLELQRALYVAMSEVGTPDSDRRAPAEAHRRHRGRGAGGARRRRPERPSISGPAS